MKEYYIYHIPGVKIGCSTRPKSRVSIQGYNGFQILEVHTDIMEASNREIELQKEYGYRVDSIPYWQTRKNQPELTTEHQRKASIINYQKGNLEKATAIHAEKTTKFKNDKIINEIREKYKTGSNSMSKLSKEYNCSTKVIFKIINYISPYTRKGDQ